MITSQNMARKRYCLFGLAILLLMLGGVGIYVGSHNYPIRALGVVAVVMSAYLVRISHAHDRPGMPEASGQRRDLKIAKGPGRLLWIISSALVPLLGAALFLLHIDAMNGGHEAWPADVFAAVGLACAIVWGYLVAKIFGGRRGKK
jgi:membrane associated rhomboid family serine protease